MRNCSECGNPVADNSQFCTNCGAPATGATPAQPAQPVAAQPAPQPIQITANCWTIAGTIIALVLLILCFIGLVSDSGTYFNRLYTTAMLWHLPFISAALLIYGIVCDKREGKKSSMALVGIAALVLAFFMSNPLKNTVADAASNVENIVNVGKNTVKANRDLDLGF
ncbi:MAG: zinc ribbon domain-containing protein [Alistipes sp.]|nr:zinc ribbon domain-containing protein [Alistipes sp.]